MWPYSDVLYVYCACFTFSGEAGIAMGWQCSLWSSPVATVTYPSFFLSFSSSLWSFRASKKGQEANVGQWETVPDVPALHTFSLSTFLALPHPSVPLLFLPGIEEGTCGFEVADSRTGSADVLALPTFSLFPVLLSSPILPTLFHLSSSSTQLENHLFVVVFFTVFL